MREYTCKSRIITKRIKSFHYVFPLNKKEVFCLAIPCLDFDILKVCLIKTSIPSVFCKYRNTHWCVKCRCLFFLTNDISNWRCTVLFINFIRKTWVVNTGCEGRSLVICCAIFTLHWVSDSRYYSLWGIIFCPGSPLHHVTCPGLVLWKQFFFIFDGQKVSKNYLACHFLKVFCFHIWRKKLPKFCSLSPVIFVIP